MSILSRFPLSVISSKTQGCDTVLGMQNVRCPLCGSDDAFPVATVADYTEPFTNVICRRCALVYANPQPTSEELETYYRKQFIQGRHEITSVEDARERARKKGSQQKYSTDGLRDRLSAASRVLEIGCSYGFLLNAIKRDTGANVFGVEPSDISGKFATEEFGIPVFHGTVEQYLETPVTDRFDLIIIYHVLEHVADPVAVLSALHDRLAPGGRLYVCVPDVTHLQEPPETFFQVPHLTSFSPWTLSLTLWGAGWKPVKWTRRLRPPKNGMECDAVPIADDRQAATPKETTIGSDPVALARQIAFVRWQYRIPRMIKRIISVVVPKKTLDRFSIRVRRWVRAIRDRFHV